MSTIFDNFYDAEFSGFIDDSDYGNLTETTVGVDEVEDIEDLPESDDMGDRIAKEKPIKRKKKKMKRSRMMREMGDMDERRMAKRGEMRDTDNSQYGQGRERKKRGLMNNPMLIGGIVLLGLGVLLLARK